MFNRLNNPFNPFTPQLICSPPLAQDASIDGAADGARRGEGALLGGGGQGLLQVRLPPPSASERSENKVHGPIDLCA